MPRTKVNVWTGIMACLYARLWMQEFVKLSNSSLLLSNSEWGITCVHRQNGSTTQHIRGMHPAALAQLDSRCRYRRLCRLSIVWNKYLHVARVVVVFSPAHPLTHSVNWCVNLHMLECSTMSGSICCCTCIVLQSAVSLSSFCVQKVPRACQWPGCHPMALIVCIWEWDDSRQQWQP